MKILGILSILVTLVGFAFLALVAARAKRQNEEDESPRFKRKPLLTANELEFLGRLEGAMPDPRAV